MVENIDEQYRTFETRLLFLNSIYKDMYSKDTILKKCINHKLHMTYEQYLYEVEKSIYILQGKDPAKIIKRID